MLALYNPKANIKISADASSFGLGAVLLQQSSKESWNPVAYASRLMTETERQYAQIEKEALAVAWSYEKFRDYILGRCFEIETDHKPLIPLLSNKRLDGLPPRVLRFRLRRDRFDFTIRHVPGKLLYTADTLSRAPLAETDADSLELQEEVETFISEVTKQVLPPTEQQPLETYCQKQAEDPVCSKVMEYCKSGWPRKHLLQPELIPYWKLRSSLTMCNHLLLYNRIIIPISLQKEVMKRIHEGHQGIERCRMRVRSSVWWPNISSQVTEMVKKCPKCAKMAGHTKKRTHDSVTFTRIPLESDWY